MNELVKTMTVIEAAAILGKPKEYVYGTIQAGVVDYGTYYIKEGKTRGTYLIPVGRFAHYLGLPISEVETALVKVRRKAAQRKAASELQKSRMRVVNG